MIDQPHQNSHYLAKDTELIFLILICVFLIFLIFGIFYYNLNLKSRKKTPLIFKNNSQNTSISPTKATPTLKPSKPTLRGYQEFTVQSTKKTGPIPYHLTIDPYDPQIAGRQTVTIKLKSALPITKAFYELTTDTTQTAAINLKLISGTPTDGTWQGDSIITDSYDYTYYMVFQALDSQNQLLKYDFPMR
ncbi:MAG: hypothetical protein WC841_04255 [Candidatus Shapirobacteria bacterium]|jgi:hypothetical protein